MLPKTQLDEFRVSGEWASGGVGERVSGQSGRVGQSLLFSHSPILPFSSVLLLATSRATIEAYCTEHGLQPRFDRSNEDTTFYPQPAAPRAAADA